MATKRPREGDEIKRRKASRNRFRKLVRAVIFNRNWLADWGEQKISLNVKKNIALLVRQQRKIGMLTMAEKALIHTHHAMRSIEDRKKLVTLMAGLTCFAKIPPKVRARLASVVKFSLVGPHRILMKEGRMPLTVYFVLTGEVEVTKKMFDRMTNTYVDKVDFIMGPGDCLGDIEMIENIPRIHTFTTTKHTELLTVFEEDFNNILRPVMGKEWHTKREALKALPYFKYFSEEQVIYACKFAALRQFEPLETIYYEDKGQVSYVHFVISGECMILQCLKMKVTQKGRHKIFDLVDIEHDADMFENLSNIEMLKMLGNEDRSVNTKTLHMDFIDGGSDEILEISNKKSLALRKMDLKAIELLCGLQQPNGGSSHVSEEQGEEYLSASNTEYFTENLIDTESESHNESKGKFTTGQEEDDDSSQSKEPVLDVKELKMGQKKTTSISKTLTPSSLSSEELNTKIENHFIDVASLTSDSVFGLGEKFEHRVIMARTTVQCLMLPRFWLFEKDQNPGNIWQRRRFYLDCTIPSRQKLFQDFLVTRKWQKFKNDVIQSCLDPTSIGNSTKFQDIPIISRIVEPHEE